MIFENGDVEMFRDVVLILHCVFHRAFLALFCLKFHFQLKVNSSSLVQVIWCFAGTATLTTYMLVSHQ